MSGQVAPCSRCKGKGSYESDHCRLCGDSTFDHECVYHVFTCLKCDGSGLDPIEAAEARGYARAVADVVAWHMAKVKYASEQADESYRRGEDFEAAEWRDASAMHHNCAVDITNGAHVGAAKKEGA